MKTTFPVFIKSLLLLLFPALLQAQTVKLSADYPANVRSGEEFLTSVRIEKGNIAGTARMQFELPAGFTAKKVNGRGSDFSTENNVVKFSWVALPDNNVITISFNLATDKTMFGKQVITGEFIYSSGERTEHVSLQPIDLNISIAEDENAKESAPEKEQVQASASVQSTPATPKVDGTITNVPDKKGEYKVELTFYPNHLNEPAQFTDILPEDYSALVIDAHESSYSFENQSVIFRWTKLPSEKSFKVSYLVRANTPGDAPVINGTLVYGDAAEVNPVTVGQLPSKDKTINSGPIKETTTIQEEAPSAQLAVATPTSSVSNDITNPVNDIYYRVQISATKHSSARNSEWFTEKFKVKSPVEMTMDEGWKKYLIGSFTSIDAATKLQNQTRLNVQDAFIVAYQNGKRIPVSEAIRNKPINQ